MTLRTVIFSLWGVFSLYWLVSAVTAKHGARGTRVRLPTLTLLIAVVLVRVFGPNNAVPHSVILKVVGTVVFVSGLSLAVWARVYLGSNWGMPMTRKDEPELVTSGPYRSVRHPIYSGLLLGLLGTALATNEYLFIVVALLGIYFVYSARVEEGILTSAFPETYPSYREHTKMLIPFVL